MPDMALTEILRDIHALATELQSFERKYGVLSEMFFEAYMRGEEPEDDAWVPDFAIWAGTYQTWLDRQREYRASLTGSGAVATSRSAGIGSRPR